MEEKNSNMHVLRKDKLKDETRLRNKFSNRKINDDKHKQNNEMYSLLLFL